MLQRVRQQRHSFLYVEYVVSYKWRYEYCMLTENLYIVYECGWLLSYLLTYTCGVTPLLRICGVSPCVLACVLACLLACLRACVLACLLACLRACLRVCVLACVRAWLVGTYGNLWEHVGAYGN